MMDMESVLGMERVMRIWSSVVEMESVMVMESVVEMESEMEMGSVGDMKIGKRDRCTYVEWR